MFIAFYPNNVFSKFTDTIKDTPNTGIVIIQQRVNIHMC